MLTGEETDAPADQVSDSLAPFLEEGARHITVKQALRQPQETPARCYPACAQCQKRKSDVRRRQCTGGAPLCSLCRSLPAHKVLSRALLRKSAPWLPEDQYPGPVGHTVNCKHPAFARQHMFLWGDVAQRCADLGLPLPD